MSDDRRHRIEVLDVLRGIAILGTLGTNIWIFTNPDGAAALPGTSADPGSVAGQVERTLLFLANGKFLALLTIMFGIGLELQYRSARRRGARWPGWYLWRTALLFAEGLAHYVLIFEYDVLMGYAVIAAVVALLVRRSDRVIRRWMVAMGTLHVAMVGALTALLSGASIAAPRTALYTTGSWTDQVLNRLLQAPVYRAEVVLIIPMGIVLFGAGILLLRAGVFDPTERAARLRSRLLLLGAVALPVNLLTSQAGQALFAVDRYLLPPLVALGILAGTTSLLLRPRARSGVLRGALRSVGRTALSCYVFQNLVAGVLCYGWGFGLAARLDEARPWWVVGAWLAISALFMTLATWWLRRAERGPLELLWHRAYLAPQQTSSEAADRDKPGAFRVR